MAYDVQYVNDANDGTGEQKADIDYNDEVDEEKAPAVAMLDFDSNQRKYQTICIFTNRLSAET